MDDDSSASDFLRAMEVDVATPRTNNEENENMGQEGSKMEDRSSTAPESTEQKLEDEIRLRKYTEDVLDGRQMELERQEVENQRLRSEIEELRKQLSDTQSHLSEARSQIVSKDRQLSDTKDQIFRLQPTRGTITEAEATEAYRGLCGNVQRWVENRLRPILDDLDNGRLVGRPPPSEASRFVSLMREAAKRGLNTDQSDIYHVIAIIMNYLCIVFFSRSFYSPLDDYEGDATSVFIDELETAMSRLPRGKTVQRQVNTLRQVDSDCPVEPAQCREWRSETLAALTSQQSFKTRRAKYINLVASDLCSLMAAVVPKASTSDLQGSLRRTIVEPAADLAHQLHLSPSVFSLKWPARGAWSRLEVYECLDLANGGHVIDLTGTRPGSPTRRNVTYLFDVAPGLFVERVEGGKKSPLRAIRRPSVLIFAGEIEVPESSTVLKWLWDNSSSPSGQARPPPSRAATPSRSKSF